MKKLPPKERPTWCTLRPLTWDELASTTDDPVWLEIKRFEHLNQWCWVDTDDITGKVTLIDKKGVYDVKDQYGEEYLAYSPLPKA